MKAKVAWDGMKNPTKPFDSKRCKLFLIAMQQI
jgi:endogenous inhibitor of DNA gyrase (YacG/DUF329 family)